MSKLEKYIHENREEFDSLEPSAELWKNIEKQLPAQKGRLIQFYLPRFSMKLAASIAIISTLGYFSYNYWRPVQQNYDVVAISPSYAKTLTQFASLVEQKRGELKKLEVENPELYQQFDAELKELEGNYQKLKADLPQNPNQEELLQTMIQNLQWQIEILNQQLQIIQKINETKNYEKANKTI